jgi:hypothetical protein
MQNKEFPYFERLKNLVYRPFDKLNGSSIPAIKELLVILPRWRGIDVFRIVYRVTLLKQEI